MESSNTSALVPLGTCPVALGQAQGPGGELRYQVLSSMSRVNLPENASHSKETHRRYLALSGRNKKKPRKPRSGLPGFSLAPYLLLLLNDRFFFLIVSWQPAIPPPFLAGARLCVPGLLRVCLHHPSRRTRHSQRRVFHDIKSTNNKNQTQSFTFNSDKNHSLFCFVCQKNLSTFSNLKHIM